MKHVRKSVLLHHAAADIYGLVTDIPRYPEFLPWCDSAEVLAVHEDGVTARLSLAYMGVRQSFTTRNLHHPTDRVRLQLVEGPFTRLEGIWHFKALGGARAGDNAVRACKVEFDLRYDFGTSPLQSLVAPVFDKVADTLVDSFVRRAEAVHGARE